jgi:hypothetical protein
MRDRTRVAEIRETELRIVNIEKLWRWWVESVRRCSGNEAVCEGEGRSGNRNGRGRLERRCVGGV